MKVEYIPMKYFEISGIYKIQNFHFVYFHVFMQYL